MRESSAYDKALTFLKGGGEMGERTRNKDWSATSLGAIDQWPQSLLNYLSLLLNSRSPMFFFWGPDLICFYNDAFRPSLGTNGKHPTILGVTGKEAWPEIWDFIGPMIHEIYAGGEATWFEDQFLPIFRNGQMEDVYWTYSYSPVTSETGDTAGVFVTCTETTKTVRAFQQLEDSEFRFRNMAEGTNILLTETDEDGYTNFFNTAWVELTGRSLEQLRAIGWTDLIHPAEKDAFLLQYQHAFQTRAPFTGELRILDKGGSYRSLLSRGNTRLSLAGKFAGYMCSFIDITEQLLGRSQLQESKMHLELLSNTVPAMIFYLDKEERYQSYNKRFMEWYRTGATEALGKTVQEFIGEKAYETILPHLKRAYAGQQEQFEVEAPQKMGAVKWLSIVYTPHKMGNGTVLGVIVHATDISFRKNAELALRESEARFRALIGEAPVATCFFVGRDMRIDVANDIMLDVWGKDKSVLGKRLRDAVPELEGQPFLQILDDVFTSGKPYSETAAPAALERNGVLNTSYFNYTYKPLFNENGEVYGVMDMAVDVTEQVQVQQRIEKTQRELLASFNDSPVGLAVITGEDLRFKMVNPFYALLTGRSTETLVDKPLLEALPELRGQGFDELIRNVMSTGVPFVTREAPVKINRNGQAETIYIDFTYQPQKDEQQQISGVLAVIIEVTQQVIARRSIEEKEAALRNAVELAELGTWSMDVATGNWTLSPRYMEMLGLQDQVSKVEEVLASIVIKDREAVAKNFQLALKQRSGGRYDAEYEVINPVTSEAMIMRTLGQVHYDKDGNPVTIAGTAQDITVQRRAQQALETEVLKRTRELGEAVASLNLINNELKRSNVNLEEFAHAASHDLKEPIRKILYFTLQLKDQLKTQLTEAEIQTFNRIENASHRMRNLIDDLLLYSHANELPLEMESIDLNKKIRNVLEDLELDIREKKANIQVATLPIVKGYRRQLQQLFQNLVSNALKYTRHGTTPEISISATQTTEEGKLYHVISVRDSGIGFEQQYAAKIFQMFTRLHRQNEYSGTGVGLSIVKKVVENHQGLIRVESKPGEGSTFFVYLPAAG